LAGEQENTEELRGFWGPFSVWIMASNPLNKSDLEFYRIFRDNRDSRTIREIAAALISDGGQY
jgi:hypothetical protein